MSYESLINYRKKSNSNKDVWSRIRARYGYDLGADGKVVVDLYSPDGKKVGKVSREAKKAIEEFNLDSYLPKASESEKKVLSAYKSQLSIPLSSDGMDFGKISYDAYTALTKGTIDTYKPKNTQEKSVLEDYARTTGYGQTGLSVKKSYELNKFGKGNIDLTNRPILTNEDGSISTVDSISINENGKEVLIPTIVRNRQGKGYRLTDEEAIKRYHDTGEFLGKFDSVNEANKYAKQLHLEQDLYYDFTLNSKYKSSANGKKPIVQSNTFNYDPTGLGINNDSLPYYTETGFDDIEHDYINRNKDAIERMSNNEYNEKKYLIGSESEFLKTMTQDEIDSYNYIYNKYGKEKAKEYIKTLTSDLNARQRENTQDALSKFSSKNGWNAAVASVGTVVLSPMKINSAIGQTIDYLDDGKIDQNAGYNKYVYGTNAVRNTVSEKISNSWAGDVGSFLYQTGMSMGDSAVGTLVGGGTSIGSLGIMGVGAFASGVLDAKDRGLSDGRAMLLGVLNGAIEVATERLSLNSLKKAYSVGKVASKEAQASVKKTILDSILTNAKEETYAEVANFVADTVVAKDLSYWQQNVDKYKKDGKSESVALGLAIRDTVSQVGLAALGGALSGAGMSAPGAMYLNNYINKVGEANANNVLDVVNEGLTYGEDTEAYKNAAKLFKDEANPSNHQIGQQVLLNTTQKINTAIDKGLSFDKNTEAYKNAKSLNKSKDVSGEDVIKQMLLNRNMERGIDGINPETATVDEVRVGDMFGDKNTNNIMTVVDKNDTHTTVEVDTGGKTFTATYTNAQFDTFAHSEQSVLVGRTEATKAPSAETMGTENVVAEEVTPDVDTVETVSAENIVPTEVENVSNPSETTVVNESVSTDIENVANNEISVVDVMNETLKPEALEDISRLPQGNVEKIAQTIVKHYKNTGSLGAFSSFFADGGEKVISAIESTMQTSKDTSETKVAEKGKNKTETVDLKNISLKRDGKSYVAYGNDAVTLASELDMKTTKQMVNGVETDVLRIPESFAQSLSESFEDDGYKLVLDDGETTETKVSDAKVLKNESKSDTMKSTTKNNSVEREANVNGSIREDLLYDDGKRRNNESARKQNGRVLSSERKNESRDGTERRSFARELIERGQTEEVTSGKDTFTLVKPEAYNDDMLSLIEYGRKKGVEVGFFVGNGTTKITLDNGDEVTRTFDGIKISPTQIYLQYDANKSPQTLFKHEYCHAKWKTASMQKAKNKIFQSLSKEDKQEILSRQRYKDYAKAYKNDMNAVWEEFICDVMSGMVDYANNFTDVVNEYWSSNETAEGYNPADYVSSKDAGGEAVSEGRYDINDESENKGDVNNGIDKSRKMSENDERHIEMQNKTEGKTIQNRSFGESHTKSGKVDERGRYQTVQKRTSKVETRKIEEVSEEKRFTRLSQSVGNGISISMYNTLERIYINDSRLDTYDFSEIITYDMLSDETNTLRNLFPDEISEYFNGENLSANQDITGEYVSDEILDKTEGTVIVSKSGHLIPIYHATPIDFKDFKTGDLGIHMGSFSQAVALAQSKHELQNAPDNMYMIKGYGVLRNPIKVTDGDYNWTAKDCVQVLNKAGALSHDKMMYFQKKAMSDNESATNELREYLIKEGYDGILYENNMESVSGTSYILFDNSQIIQLGKEQFNVNDYGYNSNNDTETVTFNSEQAKLTSNEAPTSDPDTRFSLSEPVEETKNLVAVHNVSAENLLKSFKLGGLPMPSIAIVKAEGGFNQFADISIVFGKNTIDPELTKSNVVFSSDAWTPTFPRVEYKVNEKETEKIREKLDELVPRKIQNDLGGLHLDSYNVEDALNRVGDMVKHYRYNYAMKYAFLVDSDTKIELPMRQKPLSRTGKLKDEVIIKFADSLSEEDLHRMWDGGNGARAEFEPQIIKALKEYLEEKYNDEKIVQALLPKEELSFGDFLDYAEDALKYKRNGTQQEVDYREARNLIDEKTDMAKYESWLKELFTDIVAKTGIRNNKDLYTPSGNRRNFEALHYELNLENVVKRMIEEGTHGIGGWGNGNIIGGSAVKFNSVNELKNNANNRLQTIPQSEYEKIRKGLQDRFREIAHSLDANSFSDAANLLVEAVVKYKTKSGIANYLRKKSKGWAKYSDNIVDDLLELVNDIRNMPVDYFEAKPQRAVGFNEVKAVIMPAQESYEDDLSEVKSELEKLNIPILEYEYGDNNSRIKALNSLEDVRFSLAEDDNLKTQKRIEGIAKEIGTHDELVEVARQNTQEFAKKIKENESLQKRLKNAKRQMLVSPDPVVNVVKAGKITKEILSEMESTLKASDLKDDVMGIYTEYLQAIKKSGGVKEKVQQANETMIEQFTKLAIDIAESAETFAVSDEYNLIKSYLKETAIEIPDDAKADMNYAEFRKSHMGTFNLTNDGLPIDVVYDELREMIPGMFDETITHPADQLLAIAEKLESLKPYAYNPHEDFMQDAVDHIVYRFVSEADGIAVTTKTKAQKMAEKASVDKAKALDKERAEYERKLDKHNKENEAKIQKLQKKIDDAKYVRYWEKRLSKEEKADAIKDVRDRQKKAVLKSRIRSIISDMKKNIDKSEKTGGYPKELVKVAAEVCSALDFHTGKTNKDGSPTKTSLKLDTLMAEYNALKNNENYDFQSEYRQELSDRIAELYNSVKDKRVVDLSLSELSDLKDILSEISHSLSIASKQIGQANAKANAELAQGIINSLEANDDLNDLNKRLLLREGRLEMQATKAFILNPHRINEMIAGYDTESVWWQLHEEINRGNRKAAKFVMEANKPFDELVDGGGNEIAFYDFRTKKIKTGIKYTDGSEVEIPKSIICEIMMMWNRKDGKTHLETGGAKIPDMELYNKGKTTDAIKGGKRTNPITMSDMVRLRGLLDNYDLAWIERAHHLFNKVSQDAINSTSMELVGRELARGKNYIRMYVDSDFIGKKVGEEENNITLEGHGSLKETKPKAKQPLLFRGLHENIYDNIDFVSKYYGLAIPIRNFNKVYGMTFGYDDEQSSVQEVIGKKFGAKIQIGVVEQYIKDLQTPRQKEYSKFDTFRGTWLNATFWGNISSTLKQTSSYWTGAALLDEDSLLKGFKNFAKNSKQTKAEIEKYSGTLYKRSQGLSTTELGDRANRKRLAGASSKVTKLINEKAPVLRKIPQGLRPGNWLQAMDVNTSAALWEACKIEVSKTMNVSEDGYMQAVSDLWERVIEETQSNYDVAHRPESLKSTNLITQTVTMFTTDVQQKFGLLFSSYNDFVTKSELYKKDSSEFNENAKKEAGKRLYKASRSIVYSALWMGFVSVAQLMVLRKFKSLIDDEEKEITAESVGKQYLKFVGEDMFNSIMPIGSSLILQVVDTFNNGYDFASVPSFDVIEDFIKAISKVYKAATDDEKGNVPKALLDSAYAISNFTGVPVKNVTDIIKSIKGYAGDIKELDFAHDIEDYTSGNKSFYSYGDLASYITTGNKEKEQKVLDYYSENGKKFAKGSLTQEIKPAYVQMYIDSPEKANAIKRKLIIEYDYTEDTIDEWIYSEYLKHVVPGKKYSDGYSDPEYAAEIKEFLESKGGWGSQSVNKMLKSHYKSVYKEGDEKYTKALREALLRDAKVSESTISSWEREADSEIRKKEQKQEKEKAKYE